MVSAAEAVAVLLGAASQVQAAQPPKSSQTLTTPTFLNTVPVATLLPDVHWSYDTGHVRNVVPVQPEKGSEMYYGVSDPSKSGHFAFLKYHFTVPSVNIDHTDHVTVRYHAHDGITASFSTQEAFKHALDTWSAKDGLVLIAHVPGCQGHSQGERCYFSVSDLQFNQKDLTVVAQGSSKHPDEITTSGETEWGWWDAGEANTAASDSGPVAHSPGAFSAFASPPKPGFSADEAKDASDTPFELLECVSEPDSQTGLPTACLGTSFDDILDDKHGFSSLSANSRQYLDSIISGTTPGINSTSSSVTFTPRESSRMRTPAIRSRRSVSDVWNKVKNFCKKAAEAVYNTVNDALTIGGKFDHDYAFTVPDPRSRNADSKTLVGNLRQEDSPWGKAILLTKFRDKQGRGGRLVKNMNVYCVGCGVVGHSKVTGRAKWSPRDGLSKGHIELTASLQVALKLGIYGTATLEHHINFDLLNVGLPGLSYGVVTVGPYVTLGAHVGLTAGASGKILAGAQMDWQGARVVMDLTGSNKHGTSGWNRPTFKPVFEAEGEVFVSAELGLPVGLKVGLKISSWEAAIGVVDEPSIKVTARGGLSTSLKPVPIENSTLTGGFHKGCAGIMTELSWRNRLWVGSVRPGDIPWFDTGDSSFLGKCIGKSAPLRRAEAIDTGNPSENQLVQPHGAHQTPPYSDHPVQQLTYTPSIMAPKLYDESSTSTTLIHLLNPNESTRLLSCTNGNIYAVRNDNSTNDFCSSEWETTTQHRVVVQDAFRRPMLYYGDTMSTLGVSRLRTTNVEMAPKTGVAVALVPLRDEEGTQKRKREQKTEMELYVAMDPSGEVFYPVVCDYVDRKSVSKVFLVRDMEEGLEVLKRGDVVRTVTGGEVEKCVPLAIKAGV